MSTVAEKLGAYAATLRYEDLPAEVVHQTKRTIIDTLGCAFGGYDSEPARIAREIASLVTSSKPATVLGSGQKTSLDLAAYANGVMARYLDYNDGYVTKGSGHPSDTVTPLVSAAEVAGSGGRDVIVAANIAYEIFCGICDVWDHKPVGIDAVTTSGIAVTAAAGRLLGLHQQQLEEAINIYTAGNIALYQTRLGNVSMWKGSAAPNANRNAIFATQLAARGMTGPAPIFEGRNGFFKIVSHQAFDLPALGGPGHAFRITRAHFKRFPLGNYGQPVVTAALEARKLVNDYHDIAEVHVRTSQRALNVMADNEEKWHPQNRETADHSMPYTVAVALKFGTISESHFDERYFLQDKELIELMSCIECTASEEATRMVGEALLCEIDLALRSGERKSVRVDHHRGHWKNPMSDAEVEEKFRDLAGDMLSKAKLDALLKQLWQLEDVSKIDRLMELTKIGT